MKVGITPVMDFEEKRVRKTRNTVKNFFIKIQRIVPSNTVKEKF